MSTEVSNTPAIDATSPAVAAPTTTEPTVTAPETSTTEAPAVTETAPVTTEAPKTEETKAVEETKEAVAEAPKEEAKPIYEGTLSYVPGSNPLKALIGLSKKFHFYFGEEAVASDKLAHLIKPGKSDIKETVAWSSETGKGLLYFVKHADQKASPSGVIALADVTDVKSVGSNEIAFKLHGQKNVLNAENKAEREGWLLALKEKIEEAKSIKEEVHAKEGYKSTLEKLSKTAVPAAVVAKTDKDLKDSPKKSTDERAPRSETADKAARPAKERSQSRGKLFLDSIRGKKEETPKTTEETKPEVTEPAVATDAPVAAPAEPAAATESVEAPVVAPATTETAPVVGAAAVAEEAKADETKPEEAKKDSAKAGRRSSKFFDYIRGAVSPTTEKKHDDAQLKTEEPKIETSETAPVLPETTPAVTEAAPAAETTEPTAAVVLPSTEETKPAEAATATTPTAAEKKRSSSFFGGLSGTLRKEKADKKAKEEAKPTTTETEPIAAAAPTLDEVKPVEETKPVETETAAVTEPAAASTEPATTETTAAKEAEPKKAKKENKFVGLLRNPSKALRGNKAPKDKAKTSEKLDEATEETKAEEKAAETKPETTVPETKPETTDAAPSSIGDVVPEAVNVGTAPTVKASA